MITLRINKKEFAMIASGTKKTEWRQVSAFNKKLLLCPDNAYDGKLNGNPNIKEVVFINGYKKDAPRLTVQIISIRAVKFQNNVDIPEDNFTAKAGQCAIEVKLGEIIK